MVADGLAAQHAYGVLTQALQERHKWALARVVLGGHRVLAVVRPSGSVLALHVLHFPEQLRAAEALPPTSPAVEASPEEQQLAGLLIDAACQPICWSDHRDDTAEQLRTLIQAKLKGRTLATPVQEEVPILRLLDALKRSVAQALQPPSAKVAAANQAVEAGASQHQGKKKPARKATGRRSA